VGQTYAWTLAFPILLRINVENSNIFKYALYVKDLETQNVKFFFSKIPFTRACQWTHRNVQTPLIIISVCRPCIKKETGTHNQNTKGELVLLVSKRVSCESRLQVCTIICVNCHYNTLCIKLWCCNLYDVTFLWEWWLPEIRLNERMSHLNIKYRRYSGTAGV
jgi:hypothetical protein